MRLGGKVIGSEARFIGRELDDLAAVGARIAQPKTPAAWLRAVAFWHLRFEKVHPLCEANGRIGRAILALQVDAGFRVAPRESLAWLAECETDYRRLFFAATEPLQFELLLDLLGRITGIVTGGIDLDLPATLSPRHPQIRVALSPGRIHPEKALKRD